MKYCGLVIDEWCFDNESGISLMCMQVSADMRRQPESRLLKSIKREKTVKKIKIKLKRADNREYYFIFVSRNGKTVGGSWETYKTKQAAVKSAKLFTASQIVFDDKKPKKQTEWAGAHRY